MKTASWPTAAAFMAGVIAGFVAGAQCAGAYMASTTPVASASTTVPSLPPNPSDERVEWCYVKSWRSSLHNPIDPLGPGEIHWALHGHHPHDRWSSDEMVVATGESIAEMVDRAKVLGCPLHDEPPTW